MPFKDLFNNHKLNKIYASETIRNFTLSLIEIFIPIYLLQLNYSLTQVLFFYVIASLAHIALAIPVGKFGARYKFTSAIFLGVPFQVLFFVLLFTLESQVWPLFLLAIVKEIGGTFYWVGRHVYLAQYTEDHKRGTQLGVGQIFNSIFSLPSPIIGGLVLTFYGIQPLIIIVLILLAISVIPLFLIREEKKLASFDLKYLFTGQTIKNSLLFMNHGVDNVMAAIIWPMYVFFAILTQYVALGFITFLSKFFSLISNYAVGKWFDKSGGIVLRIGGALTFFVWIGRFFSTLNFHVYLTDSVQGFTQQMIQIPFNASSYALAKKINVIHFIVFREILIHCGKLVALIVLIIVNDLKLSLIIGLVYSLGYVFLQFSRK